MTRFYLELYVKVNTRIEIPQCVRFLIRSTVYRFHSAQFKLTFLFKTNVHACISSNIRVFDKNAFDI